MGIQGIYWGYILLLNTRWVLQAQFMDSAVAHQELQQSVLGQGYGDRCDRLRAPLPLARPRRQTMSFTEAHALVQRQIPASLTFQ